MANAPSDRIRSPLPPYAGVTDAERTGLPVVECARRLGRFGFVARQLVFVQAAHMPAVGEWEFKALIGRHLWEHAVHWGGYRERVLELRGHLYLIDDLAESKLGDFFGELLYSRSSLELAIGLYEVVLPAYLDALERYVAETNPLVDQPTVRLLRHVRLDLEEQLELGHQVLSALRAQGGPVSGEAPEATEDAWRRHLSAYLAAAGGIDGTGPETPSFDLPAPRNDGDFRITQSFARDARFRTTVPKVNPFNDSDTRDQLLAKMWVRSQEMTAAELCATVLFEWEDLPYEGVLALARHCWDEVRHSLFGQAALEAEGYPLTDLPSWVGYAGHTMPFPPPVRYSHLAIATEAGAMRYPGGKRGEWEWCRDKAQHPLMTTYQDFDWADEVNHVQFGREWLVQYHCRGDRAKAQAMADETVRRRKEFYARYEARDDRAHHGY
ncbi:MAG TPA: hypothetical protein VF234_00250 [Limnochordia bacterium]